MNYYDDLVFRMSGIDDACVAVVTRTMPHFSAINFLQSGELLFAQGTRKLQVIRAPALYWTWEGPLWRYWSTGKSPWVHRWVAFRGERARAMQRGNLMPLLEYPYVELEAAQPVQDEFLRLAHLVGRADPREHADGVQLLERIFTHACRSLQRGGMKPSLTARVEACAEQIQSNPWRNWDFAHEAHRLNISYSYFRAIFRELILVPPAEYLRRCRMQNAARELEKDGVSIKAVAYDLGFADLANFSRQFKQVMGLAPRQYIAALNR